MREDKRPGDAGPAGGRSRRGALINGALISSGVLAIADNVVVHWLLGLHRAVPGPNATEVEVGLIALGTALLALGLWRERSARRVSHRP